MARVASSKENIDMTRVQSAQPESKKIKIIKLESDAKEERKKDAD